MPRCKHNVHSTVRYLDVGCYPPGQAVLGCAAAGWRLPPMEGGCRSLRMLLPFRCAFANSHLIAIDSQTHQKTTKGRTVDHDVPSRLAR